MQTVSLFLTQSNVKINQNREETWNRLVVETTFKLCNFISRTARRRNTWAANRRIESNFYWKRGYFNHFTYGSLPTLPSSKHFFSL